MGGAEWDAFHLGSWQKGLEEAARRALKAKQELLGKGGIRATSLQQEALPICGQLLVWLYLCEGPTYLPGRDTHATPGRAPIYISMKDSTYVCIPHTCQGSSMNTGRESLSQTLRLQMDS